MKKIKKFYLLLLIILVSNFCELHAQFVPFQSGQFKHLAADTLYDLTGCGAPAFHPNSYKRVVRYFDSCNGIPYWHNPKTQTWSAGGSIDTAQLSTINY